MKCLLIGVIFITGIFLFTSCQREVDGSLSKRIVADSTVLWKYIEVDTSLPPGLDTLEIYLLEYDNQKRLSSISDRLREDTSTSPVFTYVGQTVYFYNANDTLPYKKLESSVDIGYSTADTTYYTYNNGMVSSDSSRDKYTGPGGSYRLVYAKYYTNAGNSTSVIERRSQFSDPFPQPSPCESIFTYLKTYLNSNIVTENVNFSGCTNGTSDRQLVYDNKINPFYVLEIPYPIIGYNYFGNGQKNNLLEESSSNMTSHTKFSYTYRADGYPLIVRSYNVLNPSEQSKGFYFYKSL